MLPLLLTLCLSRPVHAQDVPHDPDAEGVDAAVSTPDAPAEALRSAKEAYVRGEFEAAREAFLALVQRAQNLEDVPPAIEAEAWIYLGEMRFLDKDARAADASFRMALQANPDHRVSPMAHPESVIGRFALVRDAFEDEMRQAADARRKPMPWWGYAPFGAPQFRQRRPVRGAIYAVLQVGFAAASVAAWVAVDDAIAQIDTRPSSTQADAARLQLAQAQQLRDAFSFTSAAAFYATWGISVADAGIAWRRDRAATPLIGLAPQRDGAQVVLHWQF